MALPFSAKGLRPSQVVCAILFVRILSVFLVQTWYVPDEYWQTLEVAHKQAFGYGALTWEWQKGIRSYLYPSVVAALYKVLGVFGLDSPDAVVFLPRILQAILSSVSDYSFYQWTGGRKWALFLILTSWFWFYTSGRTLLQTVETCLVTIALSKFPFKNGQSGYFEKESSTWVWLACLSVFMRPTSAPLWVLLGVYSLLTTNQGRLRLFVGTFLPVGLISASALIALDSYFHGSLVVTPWEFFRFNVLHDIASFYGKHPWHWYLTQGLPAVLGINIVPVLFATASILRRPKENVTGVLLLAIVAVHVTVYSFIPHKEFRFLLPLLPILLYLAQDFIVPWSRKARKWELYLVATLMAVSNVAPALYFGALHQAGALRVMPLLRDAAPGNRSSVLFLMPCHSTPLYSHLHKNISTRYLNCDPPIGRSGESYEAEAFFHNPQRWWRAEYSARRAPELVVLFDVLKGRVEGLLAGYKQIYEVPHTQYPEGEVSKNILVFQKTDRPKPVDNAI